MLTKFTGIYIEPFHLENFLSLSLTSGNLRKFKMNLSCNIKICFRIRSILLHKVFPDFFCIASKLHMATPIKTNIRTNSHFLIKVSCCFNIIFSYSVFCEMRLLYYFAVIALLAKSIIGVYVFF